MSMIFMEFGEHPEKDYSDGRTKQAFKDETDIDTILGKFKASGVISHMEKFESTYGDFGGDVDFATSMNHVMKGQAVFDALPAEVRNEFHNKPGDFFAYVNDSNNVGRLDELLPEIAKRGDFFPDVSSATPPGALLDGGDTVEKLREDFSKLVDDLGGSDNDKEES